MSRYFDTDPLSGAVERFHYNEEDGSFAIETIEDVGRVLDWNKEEHLYGRPAKRPGEMDAWHTARVPATVLVKWMNDYGICWWKKEHQPAMMRLLDSNEWRYLRVREFRIGGWEKKAPSKKEITRQIEARRNAL